MQLLYSIVNQLWEVGTLKGIDLTGWLPLKNPFDYELWYFQAIQLNV